MAGRFGQLYPNLTRWVTTQGWIELGNDGISRSFIRVLDEGGVIWESGDLDLTIDDALAAADIAVGNWLREVLGG